MYTNTTGKITMLQAAISTGQSVKYNPLNVFSINGRVNFSCVFKNNIGYKKTVPVLQKRKNKQRTQRRFDQWKGQPEKDSRI